MEATIKKKTSRKERAIYLLTLQVEELQEGKMLMSKGIPFTKDQLESTIKTLDAVINKLTRE